MIYSLTPSIHRKIWGGSHLSRLKKLEGYPGALPIGETWEVSSHPEGPSLLNDGSKLDYPFDKLPYLAKFIDTSEALSIQVHPGDEYAKKHENSSGKTECWIVTHAEKNAGIYLGLKAGVTREIFEAALKEKKAMNELLNFYSVEPGDFYFVPPGSIHAIGAGITLAEIQQNSGITYRVWDWNRLDDKGLPRELHIKKSLDVINFDPEANHPHFFRMSRHLFSAVHSLQLVEHENFKVTLYNLNSSETIMLDLNKHVRVKAILNLHAPLKINAHYLPPMSAVVLEDEEKILVESIKGKSSWLLIE